MNDVKNLLEDGSGKFGYKTPRYFNDVFQADLLLRQILMKDTFDFRKDEV